MSSVVSDFIFGPALRQVRRFSLSSITSSSESRPSLPLRTKQESTPSQENAICETDEDVDLRDKGRLTASQPPPSRSPVPPAMASEYDATTAPDVATASLRAIASMGPRPHQPEPGNALVETPESPGPSMTGPTPAGDTLAAPAAPRPDSRSPLPEDDGMGVLRARILEIQAQNLPAPDQARLVHQLLMENYTKCNTAAPSDQPLSSSRPVSWEQRQSQSMLDSFKFWQNPLGEAATPKTFVLTDADVKPVFAPLKPEEEDSEFRALGCPHYKRNVKSQCSSCSRWYTCRFCHDEAEDHAMVAKDTKNMLCMFCGTAQAAGEACVSCGESAAMYYCATCKLWNNDPDKPIYHCVDCGICRVGRGIGKDFFHCKKCCACLAISLEMDHRCIERSLDSDCPICGEYLHSSPKPVCIMKCGHAMHRNCYGEHIKTAYKCPICNKSVVNMETQFRNLDLAIEAQPMPEKFQDTRAVVLCNDCSTKTTVRYHWLGLRCAVCQSYNTSELQILGMNAAPTGEPPLPPHHTNNMVAANAAQSTTARDIPRRRRHSSNLVPQSNEALEAQAQLIGSYMLQERLARSVSPSRAAEQMLRHGGHHDEAEDSEDEAEDLIGFWRRVPRSITSPGILAEESESESESESDDDSTSSIDDDMDDDGDDDDDDGINLLGHR